MIKNDGKTILKALDKTVQRSGLKGGGVLVLKVNKYLDRMQENDGKNMNLIEIKFSFCHLEIRLTKYFQPGGAWFSNKRKIIILI